LAWIGSLICSGGWDGRVICTDVRDGSTRTVAEHPVATRWLDSDDRALFYVTADGRIWTYVPGAARAEVRQLARVAGEPYRIAVQRDRLLVTTRAGAVVIVDRETDASVSHATHTSVASVSNGAGDVAFSSSHDGTIQEWDGETVRRRWVLNGKLREVCALGDSGVVATLDDESIIIASDTTNMQLSVGSPVKIVATSDDKIATVVATQELIVLDQHATSATTIPIHDGEIRALGRLSGGRFAVTTSTGALYILDPRSFPSTRLGKDLPHEEDQAQPVSLDCSHSLARFDLHRCRWRADHARGTL
jgi:hypothetical protein